MTRRLLILGGTGEAVALAQALAGRPGLEVVTSLAGRTRAPAPVAGAVRSGGFGGIDGLRAYLESERIDLVVDATHPFAGQMHRNVAVAARASNRPLLRVERPAWRRQPGDRWIEVDTLEAAAAMAPRFGIRAFLTVGIGELRPFAETERMWYLVRLIEKPAEPLPLPRYEVILSRGPFTVEGERKLLERHRIDMVIAKNSGGKATYAKIEAARALGLPVLLLRRPPSLDRRMAPPTVATVADAVAWIEEQTGGSVS